jgi:O-methyltransferase involved in polyketide biosynthesis
VTIVAVCGATSAACLQQRAQAARDPRLGFADPLAVELVAPIGYPWARLQDRSGYAAGWHARRVERFDRQVRRFLAAHPDGTVVALG